MQHPVVPIVLFIALACVLTGCGDPMRSLGAQEEAPVEEAATRIGTYRIEVEIDGVRAGVFEGVEGLTAEMTIPAREPADGIERPNVEEIEPIDIELEGVELGNEGFANPIGPTEEVPEYNRVGPGALQYLNIVLKKGRRYVFDSTAEEQALWREWFAQVTTRDFRRLDGSITISDEVGRDVAVYRFTGAWPCRITGFEIDASGQAVHAGEIELVVQTLTQTP
ncbi:MAG: phage tail protein [Planctomycetota bacterium]|nr:phage tail protein [Planctomycetota bacterium]